MATKARQLSAEEIAAKKAALPSNQPQQTAVQQAGFDRYSTRGAEANAANQQSYRESLNIGIRPGQFGEIDEAAGQYVRIDPNTNRASVYDASGNVVRDAGSVYSVADQTAATRRAADQPLQYQQSGAMGVSGQMGVSGGLTPQDQEAIDRYARGEGYASAPTPADVANFRTALLNEKAAQTRLDQETQAAARATTAASVTPTQPSPAINAANQARVSADNAQLEQVLAGIPDTPEGQAIANALRSRMTAENEIQSLQAGAYDLSTQNANAVYNEVEGRLANQEARAKKAFSDAESMFKRSFESKSKLLAVQQENEIAQLKFAEEKLMRDQKSATRKQLDSMSTVMAIMGRAGSVSANNELIDAEYQGEQAIIDLQKEFGFKRTDVATFYTGKFIEAQDKMVSDWYTAKDALNAELSRIDTQGIANTKLRGQAIQQAFDSFVSSVTDSKREGAKVIYEAAKTVYDTAAAERKAQLDGIIQTKDTISFVDGLTKDINGNKFIADARAVDTRFRTIQAQMEQIKQLEASGDTAAKNFADQQLINQFNKMVDPTSVVRESEFARSAQGLSLVQQIEAGVRRVTEGGVLEPKAREELFNAAQTLQKEYNSQLQRDLQPYIARINMFNSQDGVQTKVKITDVIPSNLIPQVPQATLQMWSSQMGGVNAGYGSSDQLPGFRTDAPANGFRTDRHNNPTAMTVDVARQAGLKEGVDYEVGDPFPNNPNLKTARLIGDPIAKTIQAIDNIGFYTKGGQQRWTHTAMSKDSWNSMTYDQKSQVVAQMYQREGGTGVLVGGAQIASNIEPAFSVPTANAAQPSTNASSPMSDFAMQQEALRIERDRAMRAAESFPIRLGEAAADFTKTTVGGAYRATSKGLDAIAGLGADFLTGFTR